MFDSKDTRIFHTRAFNVVTNIAVTGVTVAVNLMNSKLFQRQRFTINP